MSPQAQLPQLPGIPSLDLSHVDLALVEELHDVTGRVLAQARGQPHGSSPVPAPTRSLPSDDPSVSDLAPDLKNLAPSVGRLSGNSTSFKFTSVLNIKEVLNICVPNVVKLLVLQQI